MIQSFIPICALSEISPGQIKAVRIGDKEILLVRENGNLFALDNVCTHDGGDLGDGTIIDGQIQCPRHGARFDLKTGAVTQMPAAIGIKTYKVKIENGDVLLDISD